MSENDPGRDAGFASLERALGHRFADPRRLRSALVHSSAAARGDQTFDRLEFLGDRVLGLVVADLLIARFPGAAEGELSRRHAALVNRDTLAGIAAAIGVGEFLRLDEGGARRNPGVLADAFEAVLAALYQDGGLEPARRFLAERLTLLIEAAVMPPQDAKTALQEWTQARALGLPIYREVSRGGPPHQPTFIIEVSIEGHGQSRGEGTSKRAAEQAAASDLLRKLGAALK